MTYTAQSLLDGLLNVSASGLIDPSLKLSGVTATQTVDSIRIEGTASKDAVTINVGFDVADIADLLGLVAASLNAEAPAATKAKPAAATKAAKPEPAPVVAAPAPVVEDDDAGDAF